MNYTSISQAKCGIEQKEIEIFMIKVSNTISNPCYVFNSSRKKKTRMGNGDPFLEHNVGSHCSDVYEVAWSDYT